MVTESFKRQHGRSLAALLAICLLAGCSNDPYRPGESAEPTYFSSFSTPPTKLDPARAYYSHEGAIIDQIYESPFSYHYLKRPYELVPQTATAVPSPVFFDKAGNRLDKENPTDTEIGRVEYTVEIRKGIQYAPHPCFARRADGSYRYRNLSLDDISWFDYPSEFTYKDSRELTAHDYALQVRRLADPRIDCPIFSALETYILGLTELKEAVSEQIETERAQRKAAGGVTFSRSLDEKRNPLRVDYMAIDFPGFVVLDDHTFKIVLKRKYPQILYWMAMHFFAPVPQEALDFYEQPAMIERGMVLNKCPLGTGPYMLDTFLPNQLMVLNVNPLYHEDTYPTEGEPGDREVGLLEDAGKRLPFIKKQVYRMESESIPAWTKFLQGYVDAEGVANDVFDQAVEIQATGDANLTGRMTDKGISLVTSVGTDFFYLQFNMKDPVIGGYDEATCKLRQAISIALDYNDFLDIFSNGRGILAQGPIPPGIFGRRKGEAATNPFVDKWDPVRKKHVRKDIEVAKRLMTEAGFPNGIGDDGKQLVLHYDHASGLEPDFRPRFDWLRNKFALLGIRLEERGTELSRFRDKRRKGDWQLSASGWLADYPDPENFMFLFYGPNGIVDFGGVNSCNYSNPEFDGLFKKMETMVNSPERLEIIDRMNRILQHDAPAVFMYHRISYALLHEWYRNYKPHTMSYNAMKYRRIIPEIRAQRQAQWNQPVWWPVVVLVLILIIATIPAFVTIYRRERS